MSKTALTPDLLRDIRDRLDSLAVDQNRPQRVPGPDGAAQHQLALGDEKPVRWLESRPQVDIGQGEQSWIVLADPEGNEFCHLRTRVH